MTSRVVLDTNVLVAGLGSRRGASFLLLTLLGRDRFEVAVSVPLVLEYEEVLLRSRGRLGLSEVDVGVVVDYFCSVAHHQAIFFLWRPALPDPADDMVLELAANAQCDAIVTFNRRHFGGADRFGVSILSPAQFLKELGATHEHP